MLNFIHERIAVTGGSGFLGREPVNLGAGFEISIRDLAEKIAGLTGFTGRIQWDISKPNGQPRRSLNVSRAEALFGFRSTTSFDAGLKNTIAWFVTARRKALAI